MRSKIFVFSGIDGSGKSLHATKLVYDLKKMGVSSKYLWLRGRGRVFFSLPLLVISRLFNITKVYALKTGYKTSIYPFNAYPPIALIWPWLQLIDALITHVFWVLFSSPFNEILVLERGVIDTYVDVSCDIGHENVLFQKLILALIPRRSQVVIFDVDEEIAITRKKDILNIEYLQARRLIYKKLQRQYGWNIITTENDFDKVHQSLNVLLKTLNLQAHAWSS